MDMTLISTGLQTLLSLVGGLLPVIDPNAGAGTKVAEKVIGGLENLMPLVSQFGSSLVTEVQGIVSALRNGSTPLTDDQIATLDAVSAQCDALFEAAATAAGFPDPAAKQPST